MQCREMRSIKGGMEKSWLEGNTSHDASCDRFMQWNEMSIIRTDGQYAEKAPSD